MDDVASVQSLDLPPGFRFYPTDEEIITHYLSPKVINPNFSATAIGEVDLNKCEPWDLPCKAKMGEEWYFFCQRDRKYPTGMRTNRATESGYWKATGKDKEICRGKGLIVGMKKTLVFYKGRAPKGHKSNWVMHEFRLQAKSQLYSNNNISNTSKDDWTVCRVFHKKMGKKSPMLVRMNFDGCFSDLNNSNNIPGSSPIDDEANDFKGNMMMMDDNSLSIPNYHHHHGAGQLPFYPQIKNPNDPGSSSSGYNLRPDHTMPRGLNGALPSLATGHYEVERFSNRSVVSADRKHEISPGFSKTGDDLDNILSSAGPCLNLENMWNC